MISKVLSVTVCSASFLYSCYTLCNLTCFLSNHGPSQIPSPSDNNIVLATLWSLFIDAALLSIFILQHSCMTSDLVKYMYCRLHIEYLGRTIYNACSAAALHLLLNKWQQVPWLHIWKIDTSDSNISWMTFTAFHVLGWSIIYSGCLMMDISELIGMKQLYYKFSDRPSPVEMKSRDLLRYYAHMRHPSFTGFLLILWIYPFMTIDRLLLALILTTYMALMWSIDKEDYSYHSFRVRRKQRELLHFN